jgi:hypothetical protein
MLRLDPDRDRLHPSIGKIISVAAAGAFLTLLNATVVTAPWASSSG